MIATYKCLEIPTSKETRKQSLLSAFAELNREAQKVLAIPGAENLDSLKILQDKLRELQGLVNAHLDSYQRIRDSVN